MEGCGICGVHGDVSAAVSSGRTGLLILETDLGGILGRGEVIEEEVAQGLSLIDLTISKALLKGVQTLFYRWLRGEVVGFG